MKDINWKVKKPMASDTSFEDLDRGNVMVMSWLFKFMELRICKSYLS